jgi:hypothetical protein
MHSLQIDLLSYAYIRTEVERLFKAYLDARLIELAKAHNRVVGTEEANPLRYWEGVLSILAKTFGWQRPTPKAAGKAADTEDSIDVLLEQLNSKAGGKNDPDTSPYLYWFDVRADYWSQVGDSNWTSLVDTLPSAKQLALVFKQAQALKQRIESEEPVPSKVSEAKGITVGATAPVSSDAVPPVTVLKNILDKVEDHAAPETKADDSRTPNP